MKIEEINTVKRLGDYLRCSPELLNKIITNGYFIFDHFNKISPEEFKDKDKDNLIEKLYIPKKNKNLGFREVYSPYQFAVANTLKILNNYLQDLHQVNLHVHGFVPGRSTKTNAYKHLAKQKLLSIDIKNFFESITQEVVTKSFRRLGFTEDVARWLSCLTCVNGKLVQGFHSSPVLANIVVHEMDLSIVELIGENVCYTRYADDMYFSTDDELPSVEELEKIISQYGFKLNDRKTRAARRGQSQYVTGLSVFDSEYPRIPKKIKRNLRLEIHYINKYGYQGHVMRKLGYKEYELKDVDIYSQVSTEMTLTRHRVHGWIHYINSIEPALGERFYDAMKKSI